MNTSQLHNKHILIIGGGPAGATVAILLAKNGLDVTLVDAKKRSIKKLMKIGECLPPDAKGLLQKLELWNTFSEDHHLKTYANKSVWGDDQIHYTDFISHPQGHGWHIDRQAFEQMLLKKASAMGVDIMEGTNVQEASFHERFWQVKMKTAKNEHLQTEFDFVIDASGRNAWLARRQGIQRHFEDKQLALIAFLNRSHDSKDASSLVETTADGWWYSAQVPGNYWATAFICKPNQKERTEWKSKAGWWNLIQQAPHTHKRLSSEKILLVEAPRFVASDSSILEQMYGERWIAIGDAAMSFDPIASHGIMMAMVSARDASEVISSFFKEEKDLFKDYQYLMEKRSSIIQSSGSSFTPLNSALYNIPIGIENRSRLVNAVASSI